LTLAFLLYVRLAAARLVRARDDLARLPVARGSYYACLEALASIAYLLPRVLPGCRTPAWFLLGKVRGRTGHLALALSLRIACRLTLLRLQVLVLAWLGCRRE
jgi:hypothetical protein